jgi:hypothetical protein
MLPRAFFILSVLLAAGLVAAEYVITSDGPPSSAEPLKAAAYMIGPFLLLGMLSAGTCGGFVALLRALRRRPVASGKPAVGTAFYIAGLGILLVGMSATSEMRVRRIQARAERLTPAVEAYFRGDATGIPALRIRGCTDLNLRHRGTVAGELWAECARGMGNWDQLLYRPEGNYPETRAAQRIGRWVYIWS